LEPLFHYAVLEGVFLSLFCSVKVVEAFLKTPDLVLK
jgi:hypothetical protein